MIRPRGDAGITLVELLVSLAIMAVILPALTGALVIGWRTTDSTVASLADSRDRQLVPSLFTRDVQSSDTVNTSTTTCLPVGDTLVVRLGWAETPATGSTVNRVAAWVTTTSGGTTLLERRSCDDSGGSLALVSTVTAAHGVVGTPSVVCRTAAGVATACSSAAVVDLSVTDASGAFSATGRQRSR